MLPIISSSISSNLSNVVTLGSCVVSTSFVRSLAVLSWGRNVEGQCGVESSYLVLRPTPIIELHDTRLVGVTCGKLNSGAVTTCGEAWTWGDGQGGKLGHGTVQSVPAPHRVESLVGRADVRHLALGDHHTLFVDNAGGLWACGENKEGQCGLGTPLDVIASQHRRAYYETLKPLRDSISAEPQVSRQQRAKQAVHALMSRGARAASSQHAGPGSAYGAPGAQQVHWGSSRTSGWESVAAAGSPGGAAGISMAGARTALNFSGLDFESAFSASGIQPGQQATPLRIGRDQHPLWAAANAAASGPKAAAGPHARQPGGLPSLPRSSPPPSVDNRMVLASGLEREVVVGIAASRYFSAALTAAGEVWTFGACYNGSLGSDQSWSTSAQKVSGSLAAALDDEGGARQVVSGGTFCAALTAGGRVVLWGKVPGGEGDSTLGGAEAGAVTGEAALGLTEKGIDIVQGGRVMAGFVPGLPPITHIAAGQQHLLLSDGQRVWAIGRTMDASGALAASVSWRRPALVLTLPHDDTVRQLVAGVHSSGVVSEQGHAWVWGRLLDRHHADSVARRHPNMAYDGTGAAGGQAAAAPLLRDDVRWEWAGFGGREPVKVEGLGGRVQSLALGGWHAMAVVE